jgi:glutamine amidotransferase
MKIGIINYEMGNLKSVYNSLQYIGKESFIVNSPDEVDSCDVIILPGVGAFGEAMYRLRSNGMDQRIIKASQSGKKVLGICLGMQLLFSNSIEFGHHTGLNLIQGDVLPFDKDMGLKIPHMGWNMCKSTSNSFDDHEGDYYFVHTFYCKPNDSSDSIFTANYGIDFCAGAKKGDNIIGLQFHPEKSQKNGISLLENILSQW